LKKNIFIYLMFGGAGFLLFLQSCNVTNQNPTVPAPLPTSTPTFTSTPTPTATLAQVTCTVHAVLSVPSSTSTPIAADYTYVDQFTLPADSNPDAVTVTVSAASATGSGNNIDIALYTDNGSNYPGSVIFTSGVQHFSSTGPATYVFNPSGFSLLGPQNYWLAVHNSVAYQLNLGGTSSILNYITSGKFPSPFPAAASSLGLPWAYSMDTCQP
jgi:hypothetical protein